MLQMGHRMRAVSGVYRLTVAFVRCAIVVGSETSDDVGERDDRVK